jgi:dynein heavy chain
MTFLNSWLRNGQPKSFFVPGFIFPQGFFTAILQNYSRRHQVSVDKLRFDFKVMSKQKTENELPKEEEGCYIHGLVL